MKYTVAIRFKETLYKICKIWYGSDGSYYVSVPYHKAKQAVLSKQTVNYVESSPKDADHEYIVPLDEALDVGSSDDARIKLSHHPDGFVQFSGQGLISGKHEDGSPKGIGIQTWPLHAPVPGPSFSLAVYGVDQFSIADKETAQTCVFDHSKISVIPSSTGMCIEGHYFPLIMRRFIKIRHDGVKVIPILHPSGFVMELSVLLPADDCPLGGFIGLSFFGAIERDGPADSSYTLSTSTGNNRFNAKGEQIGDGLSCTYPRPDDLPTERSLDYKPTPSTPAASGEAAT